MITILDGALGTELERRGVANDATSWSAGAIESAPQTIAAIHRDYAAAGATIHTANTFRTKRRSVGDGWRRLASAAIDIARANIPPDHRIAASIAPLEDCYAPARSPGRDARVEHQELAKVLVAAGTDILLCETFAHGDEAVAATEVAVATGVETWVALTAGPNADLLTPNQMATAAERVVATGADAVLVNCTPAADTGRFVHAIAELNLGIAWGAYANTGTRGWQSVAAADVREYASEVRSWIEVGASIVGGCCGTTPAHIREIAALV